MGNADSWEEYSKEPGRKPSHRAHLEAIIVLLKLSFVLALFLITGKNRQMFLKVQIKWYSLKEMSAGFYWDLFFFFYSMKDDGDLLSCFYGKSLINVKDVHAQVQIWKVLK